MRVIPREQLGNQITVSDGFRTSFDTWLLDTFGKVIIEPTAVDNPECAECFYFAKIGHRAVCQSPRGDNLMQCNPYNMRRNNTVYWCPEGK
jgi:hypothetical protein